MIEAKLNWFLALIYKTTNSSTNFVNHFVGTQKPLFSFLYLISFHFPQFQSQIVMRKAVWATPVSRTVRLTLSSRWTTISAQSMTTYCRHRRHPPSPRSCPASDDPKHHLHRRATRSKLIGKRQLCKYCDMIDNMEDLVACSLCVH